MSEEIVLLQHFSTLYEAELAKGRLEAEGMMCFIQKGNQAAFNSFNGMSGDADLFVLKKDLKKAREILESK